MSPAADARPRWSLTFLSYRMRLLGHNIGRRNLRDAD